MTSYKLTPLQVLLFTFEVCSEIVTNHCSGVLLERERDRDACSTETELRAVQPPPPPPPSRNKVVAGVEDSLLLVLLCTRGSLRSFFFFFFFFRFVVTKVAKIKIIFVVAEYCQRKEPRHRHLKPWHQHSMATSTKKIFSKLGLP